MKTVFAIIFLLNSITHAIVPNLGIKLEKYQEPASDKRFDAVGRIWFGNRLCTGTLIDVQDGIGLVLTAGHCMNYAETNKLVKCGVNRTAGKTNPEDESKIFFTPFSNIKDPNITLLPIIGWNLFQSYMDRSTKDGEFDLAVYFVDMKGHSITPIPVSNKSEAKYKNALADVVGYGRTISDPKQEDPAVGTHRRVFRGTFSSGVTPRRKEPVLLLNTKDTQAGWENSPQNPLHIPPGKTAPGDSGGPVIAVDTGEIIGVTSRAIESEEVYSYEPINTQWLSNQLKFFKEWKATSKKDGNLMDHETWNSFFPPVFNQGVYAWKKPWVKIKDSNSIDMDGNSLYQVTFSEGGGETKWPKKSYPDYVETVDTEMGATGKISGEGSLVTHKINVAGDTECTLKNLKITDLLHIHQGSQMRFAEDVKVKGGEIIIEGGRLKARSLNQTGGLITVSQYISPENKMTLSVLNVLGFNQLFVNDVSSSIVGPYNIDGGKIRFKPSEEYIPSYPLLVVEGRCSLQKSSMIIDENFPPGTHILLRAENLTTDWPKEYVLGVGSTPSTIKVVGNDIVLTVPRNSYSGLSLGQDIREEYIPVVEKEYSKPFLEKLY
jgi:V8-like Glu-specific endopeptidase